MVRELFIFLSLDWNEICPPEKQMNNSFTAQLG